MVVMRWKHPGRLLRLFGVRSRLVRVWIDHEEGEVLLQCPCGDVTCDYYHAPTLAERVLYTFEPALPNPQGFI